jgi:hypothetical protein
MRRNNGKSRAENSRQLRRVLSRHMVDMGSISFSAGLSSISITGLLIKNDGSEFTMTSVKNLVDDLSAFGTITSDLANWELTGGSIRKNSNYFKKVEGGNSHDKDLKTGT